MNYVFFSGNKSQRNLTYIISKPFFFKMLDKNEFHLK